MAKKIRVGFIGAGGIAPGHYQRLMATGKAEVVALNDPSDDSLRRFYERCPGSEKLPTYIDYRDMLMCEQLDAVEIMSPHSFHVDQTITCLKKGLHVLCEKPMTNTIADAKKVIRTAEASGKVLMLSYQRHFDPLFRYMREQIAKGAIGKVEYVQAIQSQEWLRATKGLWRQVKAISGGGQINDSGSHLVDIIMWVTGLRIQEVYAKMDNFGTEVDINSSLTMRFDNGAIGSMSIIGNAPCWREDHTIVGSKGAFYLRQGIGLIQENAVGKQVTVKPRKYTKDPDSGFIDCILGKDVPQTPPDCGLRTIEVTEAAWRSAAEGRAIRVK